MTSSETQAVVDSPATSLNKQEYLELAAAFENASAMYGLLSRLYLKEPDEEVLANLRAMRFPYETGSEYLDNGYWGITAYLSRVGESAVDELGIDYTRTFLGGGTDSYSAAYPMESVHTGRKRLAMQQARDEVLAIYRAYGLDRAGSYKQSEDHLGCELEFMEYLAAKCAACLESGSVDEAETFAKTMLNFLNDHLLNWVPKVTAQMRHFAQTDFYVGLSYLTIGYLRESKQFLEDVLA
jgi:TorA maturation chaperone TorD